ncbi:MAG: type III pantothenate kinase [Zetaproteobacteria bacterium]|nr:MAG: type III pantothenate kinase [Zetaproteobacteria bacterium]
MLLAIDVGNSEIACGLYPLEGTGTPRLRSCWRLQSHRGRTADELAWQLFGQLEMHDADAAAIRAVICASVVPALDEVVRQACARITSAGFARVGEKGVRTGMAIDYLHPGDVGADRIVNAVAARHRFGAPVIVLDCGTATTFDVVTANGHYAGGLILAGFELALEALARRAARLPTVSLARHERLIGRTTVHAMQAGAYWGAVEALSGLIRRLRRELGDDAVPVVATGGAASAIADDLPELAALLPHLTLDGLALIGRSHFGGGGR